MSAPESILALIERFEQNKSSYASATYNETQLRREFLDPFFEALGWDVTNKQGYAEAYKEVIHEDTVKIGAATKAPDYSFRIGGARKFFVEAKKPFVNIKEDVSPAFQLRRYAWSAKLPLSILSDFEEFAVYDCRLKPNKTDKASLGRVMYFKYAEYEQRWDEMAAVFSRQAILKGSFDRYAEQNKTKKGTAEVDDAFLAEIELWRELLARNIALRNEHLAQRELNFAVQRTIDRLIFLRICEDRGVEDYGKLLAHLNGENVYRRLGKLFLDADDRYNSGLFHFRAEKERPEAPDELSLELHIDDKPLKDIIRRLYYPDSPYEFSVLPADILGQVYEQFLGKVIRLTAGHRAVVEDKPEVKKAGGVFYTPTYIVDYIVKNTLGKLLEGKTPRQVSELRLLDPACGSGSFLIVAYQHLLDWHRDWYAANDPEKWMMSKAPALYLARAGEYRLTTAERKRILINNIYGVDIDAQAVEVTRLSLLLKVLEGENEQSIARQLRLFHERALPDLGGNIKCGNSLIGTDFYAAEQLSLFSDEELFKINAFDWKSEFAGIFGEGGFDVVIGNPPYVRQELLGESKEYFKQKYRIYHGVADLYAYFIEKGMSLLKENGLFSYIVANKWLRANYGQPLRQWLKQQRLLEIIDFGDLPVFKGATTYPCILRMQKESPGESFRVSDVSSLDFTDLNEYVRDISFEVKLNSLHDSGWALVKAESSDLIQKIKSKGIPLGEYVEGKIYRGILTGLNEAFVIDAVTKDRLIEEDPKSAEIIKPFLLGRDIKRYGVLEDRQFLIFIPKGWTNANSGNERNKWNWFALKFPAIAKHLKPFEEKAMKRFDQGEYWWELRACEYYSEFGKSKIIYPNICKKPEFTFDDSGSLTNQKCFIIGKDDKYLIGVLNSSLLTYLFQRILPKLRGDFYEPSFVYFKDFPIVKPNLTNETEKERHDQIITLVDQMLETQKSLAACRLEQQRKILEQKAGLLDRQIDRLVYDLYELTEEDIAIIERGK